MQPARLPDNEQERLAVLRAFEILDTPPEAAIDEMAKLASAVCGAPVALVTLIEEHRQWFVSAVGTDRPDAPREFSFCQYALLQDEVFEVPDALEDSRFADSPVVAGAPHIRFYAGQPLMTRDGHALGTVCVLDVQPRKLTDAQRELLRVLSHQVMAQFELRRSLRQLTDAHQHALEFGELKDNFMRIASHDLKNPLTAMIGTASLMEVKLQAGSVVDETAAKLPPIVSRAAKRMKGIVEDFLDFRAVADGRLELKRAPLDLHALAQEIVAEMAEYSEKKGIAVELTKDGEAGETIVEADASRLRQVIANLIGNAIKFSLPATRVRVRTVRGNDAGRLRFEVADEGPGLRDEDFVKLFGCYAKLSNKPTGGEHSSGLGLFLCKNLIEAHAGEIGANNHAERGAVFWFELPVSAGRVG